MRRPFLLVAAALGLAASDTVPASAHGGQFVPPPIWNPNPQDPNPGGGKPQVPGATTPPGPPLPGAVTAPDRTLPPGPTVATAADLAKRWETWWDTHRDRYVERRGKAFDPSRITPSDAPDSVRLARAAARRGIAAHLLRTARDARAKGQDDLLGSSLIALGKVCEDAATPRVMEEVLADAKESTLARSSAALALGLLRRSDPVLRHPPETLARVRGALLATLDESETPTTVRAFAALALGLLGDQGTAPEEPPAGRALLSRLTRSDADQELSSAILTAVGMQDPATVSEGNRDLLVAIAVGRRVLARAWTDVERSHALTAEVRLGGERGLRALLGSIGRTREPDPVRRAAYLVVGQVAATLTPEDRLTLARAILHSLERSHPDFERGLAYLALAHVLQADLAAGQTGVLRTTPAGRTLLREAQEAKNEVRGYAILALGLASRVEGLAAVDEKPYEPWLTPVRRLVAKTLAGARTGDPLGGAWAAAAGYARVEDSVAELASRVGNAREHTWTRGVAAVALAHAGRRCPEARAALLAALEPGSGPDTTIHASAGLAAQGVVLADTKLIAALEAAPNEHRRTEILIAIGRLGDLAAVEGLVRWMGGADRSENTLALAAAALGLLADPEPVPSLERLRRDGNYASRTYALNEVWSIF